jgi:hypothetical protein
MMDVLFSLSCTPCQIISSPCSLAVFLSNRGSTQAQPGLLNIIPVPETMVKSNYQQLFLIFAVISARLPSGPATDFAPIVSGTQIWDDA